MTDKMDQEELLAKVERAVEPILQTNHVELIELGFRRHARQIVLQFLVDKPSGGITLQECAGINEQIGALLDTQNLIEEVYVLEVASPGLDRPLKSRRDFERVEGELLRVIAKISLETPQNSEPGEPILLNLIGTLIEAGDDGIVLEEVKERKRWEISYGTIVRAVREIRS